MLTGPDFFTGDSSRRGMVGALAALLSCGAAILTVGESGAVIRRKVALIKIEGVGSLCAGPLTQTRSSACKASEMTNQTRTRRPSWPARQTAGSGQECGDGFSWVNELQMKRMKHLEWNLALHTNHPRAGKARFEILSRGLIDDD